MSSFLACLAELGWRVKGKSALGTRIGRRRPGFCFLKRLFVSEAPATLNEGLLFFLPRREADLVAWRLKIWDGRTEGDDNKSRRDSCRIGERGGNGESPWVCGTGHASLRSLYEFRRVVVPTNHSSR